MCVRICDLSWVANAYSSLPTSLVLTGPPPQPSACNGHTYTPHGNQPEEIHVCDHTPSIAFRHLPPNSATFRYAIEGALFITTQLSTDMVSALRKVWVLIRLWKQPSIQAHSTHINMRCIHPGLKKRVPPRFK